MRPCLKKTFFHLTFTILYYSNGSRITVVSLTLLSIDDKLVYAQKATITAVADVLKGLVCWKLGPKYGQWWEVVWDLEQVGCSGSP